MHNLPVCGNRIEEYLVGQIISIAGPSAIYVL